MRKTLKVSILLLLANIATIYAAKREFRGAWLHTIDQWQYKDMDKNEMKAYLSSGLDKLADANINAIIFQVRPECDAWYKSKYEPWSRYITGTQGKDPGWDPLAFMVKECHKRGMEIHAWINPYRVRAKEENILSKKSIGIRHPEWCIKYGKYIWLDPGLPESRQYILKIISDIETRYDIDAIHIDDYFYPYPIGKNFDDSKSFKKYGIPAGYTYKTKDDWRRNNVNILIKEIHDTIHAIKPWVQFGISPFGIYLNKKDDPRGSNTNGLTNYKGLFADVLKWIEDNAVDYIIPQLYWEIGNKYADYNTLIEWWSKNSGNVNLYIGQDVLRTVYPKKQYMVKGSDTNNQITKKLSLAYKYKEIKGNCFWPGYEIIKNSGNYTDSIKDNYFKYPALLPLNRNLEKTPEDITGLFYQAQRTGDISIGWSHPDSKDIFYYVIYGFNDNETANTNNPENIINITRIPEVRIKGKNTKDKYIITAIDRYHNESKGKIIDIN